MWMDSDEMYATAYIETFLWASAYALTEDGEYVSPSPDEARSLARDPEVRRAFAPEIESTLEVLFVRRDDAEDMGRAAALSVGRHGSGLWETDMPAHNRVLRASRIGDSVLTESFEPGAVAEAVRLSITGSTPDDSPTGLVCTECYCEDHTVLDEITFYVPRWAGCAECGTTLAGTFYEVVFH